MTTLVTVAMIQALIPLGLRAVEDALVAEVQALAGRRGMRATMGVPRSCGGAHSAGRSISRTVCGAANSARAYAHPTYAEAKRALERLHRELRVLNESAAARLAEGLDETLTLRRLNVFPELGVSFKTTNLLESVMVRLDAKTRRVTRWRTSDQKLRWCASALWAMERQFRRVKQYRHLPLLKHALQFTLSRTNSAAS